MKKYLSLFLSALMILSLFGMSSCSEEDVINYALDAAIEFLEEETTLDPALHESAFVRTEQQESESLSQTESETESETQPETEPETEAETQPETEPETEAETEALLDENGSYDDKDNVALYIHLYGKLPPNYITKKETQDLGWEGGSVEKFAPGKCIGGSYFGNYEGNLPTKKGREYHECDIDTLGKSSRGAKRIVYSNDGLIYYTDDHYETFELLYGEE